MIQAIEDLRNPKESLEAKKWFLNTWNNTGIGSFPWVCMTLDMDPARTLKKILALTLET